MTFEIIELNHYDSSKLEKVHQSARKTLRMIYKPKTDAKFVKPSPLEETMLVVKKGDLNIGTTKLHYYKDHLHMIGLGVHEDHRGQGVCRLMVDYIKNKALSLNKSSISLYTIQEVGHVEMFNKFGFCVKEVSVTDDFISEKHDVLHEVYMVLELKEAPYEESL